MLRGKKEACRNFIQGSCRYGDHCKFSHSSPAARGNNNNNPFGFGTLAQPPTSAFGSNQPKPFHNKWTAASIPAFGNNKSADQSQSALPNHTCTNPDACKRLMLEDFQSERPLWKLTCYGHFRHLPCDIVGDISYEELRAAAYDDAKKGLSLSTLIERERNMVNAKLIEFENLTRNRSVSQNAVTGSVSHFPNVSIAQSPTTVPTNTLPQSVSTFSKLGFTTNQEFKTSAVASSNSSFGQHSSIPIPGHTSGSFGTSNLQFGAQGLFGKHMQSQGNASTGSIPFGFGSNLTTPSSNSMHPINFTSNQAFNAAGSLGQQTAVENSQGAHGGNSIWLKDKWNPGEVPDEAPPSEVCT